MLICTRWFFDIHALCECATSRTGIGAGKFYLDFLLWFIFVESWRCLWGLVLWVFFRVVYFSLIHFFLFLFFSGLLGDFLGDKESWASTNRIILTSWSVNFSAELNNVRLLSNSSISFFFRREERAWEVLKNLFMMCYWASYLLYPQLK